MSSAGVLAEGPRQAELGVVASTLAPAGPMTGRAFLRSKTEAEADERRGASAGPRQAELGVVASTLAPALAPIQPHFACG